MAASSSTAAYSNNNQWYEVFLSHRGVDTKETFARSLYLRLLAHGLKPFLDNPEMQAGYEIASQIQNAIRTASVHVAILSAGYAESTWCLDELRLMLESKAPIIPVFYGVTPAEVRWTRGKDGIYAQALRILEKKTDEGKPRYEPNTIENWRNALSQVAEISGFELKTCHIGDDEVKLELVDKVVKAVKFLSERKKPDFVVAEFPTGLDEKLKDFEDSVLLQQQTSAKPRILGIWGLGGVGKTTLAQEFFNKKKSDYHISCFLSHDSDKATKDSLILLQKIFLKSLTGLDKQIDTVNEGKGMLKNGIEHLHFSNASLQRKHDQILTEFDKTRKSVDVDDVKHLKSSNASLQRKQLQSLTVLDDVKHLKSSNASLQRKQLQSLTVLDKPIDSVDVDGVKNESKVLVILDNIHKPSQVDALLPVDLPSGSLILITSRDKRVLITSKVENSSIYMLSGLNNQHSRELFCSHAFNQASPLPGFESLVDNFLEACNGLPLSLKVIAAHLYGGDISFWEDELGSLKQILPSEIKERLRISYDALDEQEQQIFLDSACFFIGKNRSMAMSVWNASGWNGRRGFQNLQDKCLVDVDSGNVIQMHDHLRDLGRDIAEKSSPRRLVLWTKKVTADLLHQPYEIEVRGIKIGHDQDDVISQTDTENALPLRILRKLKILDTVGERILRIVEPPDSSGLRWLRWIECPCTLLENILRRIGLPKKERILRTVELPSILWLSWINCPYSSLPSGILMKNLRVLQVSGIVLNTLWQKEGESQESLQLPVYLEMLLVDECVKLRSIEGLAQLTNLRVLSVSRCTELEELPSMETLVSLEKLSVDGCVQIKSIRGLAQCTNLELLVVSMCAELEELPSMETLTSLEELWAKGCVKLKSIQGLERATKLRVLNIIGCSQLQELPSMETLTSLEVLHAEGCVKLKSIRGLSPLTKLRLLNVTGCSELELPSVETLVSLEKLWVDGCVQLKSIAGLGQCTNLILLDVGVCAELEELPSMETLTSLEVLRVEGCVKLKSIPGLERATKLSLLNIIGCSQLQELPSMETLTSLVGLWAKGCVQLKSIAGLGQCTNLELLDVSMCAELEELPSMETLTSLEKLGAKECVKLKSIQGLERATKLRILNIIGWSQLQELSSMETLTSLEELHAEGCVKLKSIRGLSPLTKLRLLNVTGCSELELPSVETLVSLEKLWVDGCVQLKSIAGLGQCTNLELLNVTGCSELEELPSLETLTSLEQLGAEGCVKLKSIRGLSPLTKLRRLNVTGCSELELPSVETLVSLEKLWVDGCVQLKSIAGLGQCTNLELQNVSMCAELEELPSMETLTSLEVLRAKGCVKLKSIRGLSPLTKLRLLNVSGCSELEEVEGVEHCTCIEKLGMSRCPKLQCPLFG